MYMADALISLVVGGTMLAATAGATAYSIYDWIGDKMRVAVIDGQGGGIGKAIVEKFRKEFEDRIEIVALGTNSLATSLMLKAGAMKAPQAKMLLFTMFPRWM